MTLKRFFELQVPFAAESIDLGAIALSRAAFREAVDPMHRLRSELLAGLPERDPEMPLTGVEADAVRRLQEDIEVLEKGNWALGISDPRLQPFVGGPGINHLVYWIAKCDEVTARETTLREMTWPATFTFTGRPGTTRIDGRVLRRGDIVALSRAQYDAWSDKFAAVTS